MLYGFDTDQIDLKPQWNKGRQAAAPALPQRFILKSQYKPLPFVGRLANLRQIIVCH
jgi:hypothetical protein